MKYISLLATLSLAATISACGGTQQSPAEPDTSGEASADEGLAYQACVAGMNKARECTDEYIPALVDLRISLDMPAGIAQAAADQGRDAVVAAAMDEWKTDSTDDSIAGTCQNMAASVPEEHAARMSQASNECAAKPDCGEFVTCVMPLQEQMFQMAAGTHQ